MADNSFSAGDLSLSIGTVADDTLKKLDLLAERLSFIEGSLKNISGTARQTTKSPRGRGNSDSAHKSLLNIGKWGVVVASARRLGRFMGNIVQAGSDYTETLNLWQVAMRENLDLADEFVNKMSKAYGISSKTLMNAQATFKNMIGSLGQISDSTAYALSEALVQMSADFSSLYNVTLESAFEKMKSMLAGQVRPIRSAGLDMTETTLYMFYQQIGGTKTMRQLNRTEKQLLSILAVYQQMGSAGALGDMTKTLNQFANQSRMMTEYWAELKAWSGLILKDWLDQNQVLIYINAALITMTEIIKAIAKSKGLGEENFIDGMFESVEATNDEIDELQGKLLDFDKFRSLERVGVGDVGIDQKLLDAISGYSSQIDNAVNAAQELAEKWMLALGWTRDENGQLVISEEKLENIRSKIAEITSTISALLALRIVSKIGKFIKALLNLKTVISLLNNVLTVGALYAMVKAIEFFKDGDYWGGIFATTIGVTLAGAFIALKVKGITASTKALKNFISNLVVANISSNSLAFAVAKVSIAFVGLAAAVAGAFLIIANWSDMNAWQKTIGIIGVATTAVLGLAMAFGAFHSAWSMGLATAGIAAGIAMIVASIATVKKDIESMSAPNYYATGASDIDSGTLFVAGEMGKTEMVYNGNNGKTNVANVQQMQQAMYNALVAYGKTQDGNGRPIEVYLDGEKVYQNTTAHAKQRGYAWSHV
jgi:hypothetical protein